jgi:NADPH:quinone reductase
MSATTASALIVTRHGGRDVLEVSGWDLPSLGAGQVQVAPAACGVNFIDVYQREGIYPVPTPFVLGGEGAGEVVAIGPGVADIAVGDRVAWAGQPGSAATAVNVAAAGVVPVPSGLDIEVAAAVMLQGMTAHYLVNSTYAVQPGDSLLVHAAAGGTGQLLVQLAKAKGARVIATVGTAEKRAKVLALGADAVLRYDDFDDAVGLAAAIRDANGGAGVRVVYDGVGQATFDASLAALAPRGLLAIFGAASGQVPPFDVQRLNAAGSLYVTRPTLANYISDRAELLERAEAVLTAVAEGSLRVEIGGRYPLTDAARAYEALENRASTGKLLLIP